MECVDLPERVASTVGWFLAPLCCINGLLNAFGLKKNRLRDCGGVGQLCVITVELVRGLAGVRRVFGSFSGWPNSTPEDVKSCRL